MIEEEEADECQQILNRILEVDSVQGYVVFNEMGLQENKHIENTTALQYSTLFWEVTKLGENVVRDLDPSNKLLYFRIKTKRNEILAALANDDVILVAQRTERSLTDTSTH